jgi:hypothetical protein
MYHRTYYYNYIKELIFLHKIDYVNEKDECSLLCSTQ